MNFVSIDFAWFLPLVFLLYWFVFKQVKSRNYLIVIASYVFYGWWDWRFLFLILFSTLVDYSVGYYLEKTESRKQRKLLLILSLIVNLGLLGVFKYYDFFLENMVSAFSLFGSELEWRGLNIILPVGISFYTFQTLSYTIDVYRGKMKAEKSLLSFSAYVSFFPQLVAGPIERATNLLPQFSKPKKFDYAMAADGCRQILWGFVKKVIIADGCAEYANMFFNNHDAYGGSGLLLGAFFFTFQIYGDFSGYSDIAIGTSKLFGFNLMQNFAYPYFSRDIAEFWRRWHISLSTWFRDYLYIPLGGSKGSLTIKIRNVFIIFLVSGFWHGANWTFIVWGALNAIYFLPLMLLNKNRANLEPMGSLPSLKEVFQIGLTFTLTTLAWVFFRANDIGDAFTILNEIFSSSLFEVPEFRARTQAIYLILMISIFVLIEWLGKENSFALESIKNYNPIVRWTVYTLLFFAILVLGNHSSNVEFIYFQF